MRDIVRLRIPFALLLVLVLLRCGTAATTQPATTQANETHFLRFVGDGTKGGALETSDVTFTNADGKKVRLIAAVHIAEAAYFRDIQSSVERTDAVLYEMVKPNGSGPPQKGVQSDHAIAQLQRFLKDRLDLSFQLDEVDYTPKNFVHADLDAETFQQMQSQRGESFASMMLASLLKTLSDPAAIRQFEDEPIDVVDLMTRPDGERQIKLLLARHLGDFEKEAMGMNMLDGTVILTERNKAVMRALDESLATGNKEIAIFYGAAHMPDLAKQLEQRGFKPTETKWRAAWDVRIRDDQPSAFQKLIEHTSKELLKPPAE
ncbi:MAG: hypothetical protein QOE14_3127 [Humisphaera sp.]|nr:hypothetical protein [Humisphaera sp.]